MSQEKKKKKNGKEKKRNSDNEPATHAKRGDIESKRLVSNPVQRLPIQEEAVEHAETSDKVSPFEDLLINQLNGLMALVLTTAVLKNDTNLDQNELKYQIAERNGRAKEAVRGELELIMTQLPSGDGHVNKRIHACNHLFSNLLRDLEVAVFEGVERGILTSLRAERDVARTDLSQVQDHLSQQVGILQTALANLQARQEMEAMSPYIAHEERDRAVSRNERLLSELRSQEEQLRRSQESLLGAHRDIVGLRLQGLHWKQQTDEASGNLIKCVRAMMGFIPEDIARGVEELCKVKPPGDEVYVAPPYPNPPHPSNPSRPVVPVLFPRSFPPPQGLCKLIAARCLTDRLLGTSQSD
eukprot:gene24557-33020_t